MDISTKKKIKDLDFLNYLITFPLLTKLRIVSGHRRYSSHNLNTTIHLPNLIDLDTHQWIFNSATFVLPELRKLYLNNIYDSSLDNIKELKKLKKIQLEYSKEEINEPIDLNLIFSFSNLNDFYCKGHLYDDEVTFDFASDEISYSLIHLTVGNRYRNAGYREDKNSVQLRKKRIPFLY